MCSTVICNVCKKYTWSGCGQHIEEALHGIPKAQLCTCSSSDTANPSNSGFFSKLLGVK